MLSSLPIIDLSLSPHGIAKEIRKACKKHGFFYISNHGIEKQLQKKLEKLAKDFFSQNMDKKMEISMDKGGKAWRGYFALLDELTANKPDYKEGIYFGEELPNDHPKVQKGVFMHGKNLFPSTVHELEEVVLEYISKLTHLGHKIMRYLSLSLGLNEYYFRDNFTFDPLVLFRVFHYPATTTEIKQKAPWGVGEHTDYGLLTILKQDHIGGLQVKSNKQWIDVPHIESTFVCNIGDMLDKLTGGYYISTPHRVQNTSKKGRYSYPFFFDPNFDAKIKPINLHHLNHHFIKTTKRWDNNNIYKFDGTYGDYILEKTKKVFPKL